MSQTYALVIGLTRYRYHWDSSGDLLAPQHDAEAFCKWVTDPAGGGAIDGDTVRCILSSDYPMNEPRPTQWEIDDALIKLVEHARQQIGETTLYFYFSGHGWQRAEGIQALMLPSWDGLYRTARGLWVEKYRDCLALGPFTRQFFFLDACRLIARQYDPQPPSFTVPAPGEQAIPPNRCVLYAASDGEAAHAPGGDSLPISAEGKSFFTDALIDGLKGKAARLMEDGRYGVTPDSLYRYVKGQVPERLGAYLATLPQDERKRRGRFQIPKESGAEHNHSVVTYVAPESVDMKRVPVTFLPAYEGGLHYRMATFIGSGPPDLTSQQPRDLVSWEGTLYVELPVGPNVWLQIFRQDGSPWSFARPAHAAEREIIVKRDG